MATAAEQAVQKSHPSIERQKAVLAMADSIGESIPTSLGSLIKTEQIIKAACAQIAENELLSQCSVSSIKRAVLSAASQGLIPGFAGQGWFVPYKTKRGNNWVWECQWITGWQGKLAMLRREGTITFATVQVVYEKDDFSQILGFEQDVKHIPARGDRGAVIGAYFAARDKDGQKYVEWMPVEDLEKARKQAQRGERESPAWRDWTDEMYRKTVTHRACKRLPLSPDLMSVFEAQMVAESGGFTVDVEPERPAIEMPRRKSAALPAPEVEDEPAVEAAETEADSSETAAAGPETKAPETPRFILAAGELNIIKAFAEDQLLSSAELARNWAGTKKELLEAAKEFNNKQSANSNPQPEQGELIK